MNELNGIIEIGFPLIVHGMALREEYIAKLGKHEIVIHFPRLPEQPSESGTTLLVSPTKCDVEVRSPWGYLNSYNKNNYLPESSSAAVNQVFFECSTDDVNACCEDIQMSIDDWRLRLFQILCLDHKRDYAYNGHSTSPGKGLYLFNATPALRRYNTDLPISFTVIKRDTKDSLSQTQIEQLLLNTSLDKKIKMEYALLALAYQEMSNKEYRYSLIQALSAVEICVSNTLIEQCKTKSIDANLLLGKKSLGDKFEMLRAFGLTWPTKNPNEDITKLRNDVFHSRLIMPTSEIVVKLLENARLYLETFSLGYFE